MENSGGMFKKGKKRFLRGVKYFYYYEEKSWFEFLNPCIGHRTLKAIFDLLMGFMLMAVGIPMKAFGF